MIGHDRWRHGLRRLLPAAAMLVLTSLAFAQTQPAARPAWRTWHGAVPDTLYVSGPGHLREDGSVDYAVGDRIVRYWPADNRVVETPLPVKLSNDAATLFTSEGLWSLGGTAAAAQNEPVRVTTGVTTALLVRPDGSVIRGELGVARFRAQALALPGGDVLLVGGRLSRSLRESPQPGENLRTTATEIVRLRDGRIEATRVADLPGAPRWGAELVVLRDGRVFAAGGAASFYVSCYVAGCTADAYVFDPRTGRWDATAPMSRPRAGFTATLLPDGRVLAVGGLTSDTQDAIADAEVWDPATGRWSAVTPAPAPVAQHQARWMAGEAGRTLLIGGGTNPQIQALDVPTMRWRTVGHAERFAVDGNLLPWQDRQGRAWATVFGGVPEPRGQNRGASNALERIALAASASIAGSPASPIGPSGGVVNAVRAWPRHGVAQATDPTGRVLLAGGFVDADPGGVATASAELTSVDNAPLQALPAMNHRRAGAKAVWLGGGDALVFGGHDTGYGRRDTQPAPAEVFDARSGRWRDAVDADTGRALDLPERAIAASAPGGGAIVVNGATADRLAITDGRARREALPDLRIEHQGGFIVRTFDDGRIVVAGGARSLYMVEVAEAPGRYRGHGPAVPAERHERFDPVTARWQASADADIGLPRAAVLDDGSVAGIGERSTGRSEGDRWIPAVLAAFLSTPDGRAWRPIPLPADLSPQLDALTLEVHHGELYLQGPAKGPEGQSPPRALWWFDRTVLQWARLADWRHHAPRLRAIPARRPDGASVLVGID